LTDFDLFSFGALSLLSLSRTLGSLEFSWRILGEGWHGLHLEKEGNGRPRKHKRTLRSTTKMGFACRYEVNV